MITRMSLGAIWFYQTYISPRKGFSCAHRVAHGGTGCSGYAKEKIREMGLVRAVPLIRERFRDCSAAAEDIRSRRRSRAARRRDSGCDDACELGCCVPDALEAASCGTRIFRSPADDSCACDCGPF